MNVRDARILLVEDNPLISIDAEDMLRAAGAAAVFVAHTLANAESLLAGEAIDAAVLDVRIGSGRSDGLARALRARGVPFIVTTGYAAEAGLSEGLDRAPTVGKPYTSEALLAAFAMLDP